MRRVLCGGCTNPILDKFLDLGSTPLANSYPATTTELTEWYPLELAACGDCGLVQLLEVVDDALIYSPDYGFYSGASAAQLDYHRKSADLLLSRFPDEAKRLTVEVACNDGSLLAHFAAAGCSTLGIDPAYGPATIARERGLDVLARPLTVDLAQTVREQRGPAGLVIAYNCMAHIADLGGMLDAVRTLMDQDSVAVFEVQYLPDLLAGNMYDQVYHEHRFFYSLTSLRNAARRHGLHVIDAELIELQGGGLRVTLSANPDGVMQWSTANHMASLAASEAWLPLAYPAFQGKVDRTRDHLRSLVEAELEQGRTVAGYGAAAKATTILNFCGLGPEHLRYVIDTTPHKQGRYVPGTGIPIVSPDAEPVDTLLLLVPNYLGAVLRSHPHQGRWITPQPLPMVL